MPSEAHNTQYAIHDKHLFLRVTDHERRDTNKFVRIYKLFMQNKANFMHFSPENNDCTKKQTQLNPIKAN